MSDKSKKVGPQGTQVFDLSDVESMIAEEMRNSSEEDGVPALVGVSPSVAGARFLLKNKKYKVGRTNDCEIKLDEPSVSSTHAQLMLQNGQWKVNNLLSSNGTYVNGDKVAESDIFPGDRIRFGGVEFLFTKIKVDATMTFDQGVNTGKRIMLIGGAVIIMIAAGAAYFFLG